MKKLSQAINESFVSESVTDDSGWYDVSTSDLAVERGYMGNGERRDWDSSKTDSQWMAVWHDQKWPLDGTRKFAKPGGFIFDDSGFVYAIVGIKPDKFKAIIEKFMKSHDITILTNAGFKDVED